jgi:hypothetical protein
MERLPAAVQIGAGPASDSTPGRRARAGNRLIIQIKVKNHSKRCENFAPLISDHPRQAISKVREVKIMF